jgi:amidase
MTTWITQLDCPASATGPRIAVKDAIDVDGVPTTVGCPAIADEAKPADRDAACLAGARAVGARFVGKANLHELCFGTTGVNPWFGTPANPLDPSLVPGGSSSGSTVAVATDEADIGYGTDTGGSVRIPAACCGVVGLKTTWGRIPLDGVWPLAPSLDTVGPLARDVATVTQGMRLLDPSFSVDGAQPATTVGRVRGRDVDPAIDDAIDAALRAAEIDIVDVTLDDWDAAQAAFVILIVREAWDADRELLERAPDRVDPLIAERLRLGSQVTDEQLAGTRQQAARWIAEVNDAFSRAPLLALPTLPCFPPALDKIVSLNDLTSPFNLAGTPALSLPVPAASSRLPASLQLVAPHNAEALLCATGSVVEAAVGYT